MPHETGGAFLQQKSGVKIASPAALKWTNALLLVSLFLFSVSFGASDYLSSAKIAYNGAYATSVSFSNFLPIESIKSLDKSTLDSKNIESLSLQILSENQKSLNINPANLRLQSITHDKSPFTQTSGFFFVFFQQYYQNVPVRDSEVKFLYIDDKLASMNAKYYLNIKLEAKPKVNDKKAAEIAKTAVKFDAKQDTVFNKELYILPISEDGSNSRLTWFVDLTSQGETFQVVVDAMSGEVISKRSTAEHAFIEGSVTGVVYDDYNPPYTEWPPANSRVVPFKDLRVAIYNSSFQQFFNNALTDENGFYSITYTNTSPATLISRFYPTTYPYNNWRPLESPYTRVRFKLPDYDEVDGWLTKTANHTYNITSPSETHDWLWDETANWWSDNNAEANTFYHLGKAHDYYTRGIAPFNIPINFTRTTANTRGYMTPCYVSTLQDAGNASNSLLYLPLENNDSAIGCPKATWTSDVIYHEYGHVAIAKAIYGNSADWAYIDQNDYTEGGAMEEAFGDYLGATINNDPRGPSIRSPPSPLWGYLWKQERNLNNSKRFPQDFVANSNYVYNNSLLFSGALWDLRENFKATYTGSGENNGNGTHRADAMILYAFKYRPRNYSQFMNYLILVSAAQEFGGDGNISNSPDRSAICDAFNYKHSITPDNATIPEGYCARAGDVYATNSSNPLSIDSTYLMDEPVYAFGTNFAPRTKVNVYVVPHVEQRINASAITGIINSTSNVNISVYSNFTTGNITNSNATFLWQSDRQGAFDIIVDTNRDGIYSDDVDSIGTFEVLAPTALPASESRNYTNYFMNESPIYCLMQNLPDGKIVNVLVVDDISNWSDGMPLPQAKSSREMPYQGDDPGGEPPLWPNATNGTFDIVVDYDRDGYYNANRDTVTSLPVPGFFVYPFKCDIMRDQVDVAVSDGQQHYFSIYDVSSGTEFPTYSDQTKCREFRLTNNGEITGITARNALFDDEGFFAVNGYTAHYWWARPRAPLTMDINTSFVQYGLKTGDGETNTIILYAKDIYTVVQGATVQLDIGENATCVQENNTASQASECCTGIRNESGICVCKPDGTYAESEQWSYSLCCSGIYTPRMCAANGGGGPPLNCGDGACDPGEDCQNCPADCPCPEGTECTAQGASSGGPFEVRGVGAPAEAIQSQPISSMMPARSADWAATGYACQ